MGIGPQIHSQTSTDLLFLPHLFHSHSIKSSSPSLHPAPCNHRRYSVGVAHPSAAISSLVPFFLTLAHDLSLSTHRRRHCYTDGDRAPAWSEILTAVVAAVSLRSACFPSRRMSQYPSQERRFAQVVLAVDHACESPTQQRRAQPPSPAVGCTVRSSSCDSAASTTLFAEPCI